jgi:hypothetical protein
VFARRRIGADNARQRVAVRNAQPGQAQFARALDHFLAMRSPAQEREIRARAEFGKTRHANSPWMNQRGVSTWP